MKKIALCFSLALLLTACKEKPVDHSTWVGKWNGPEGTYLEIKSAGNGYVVNVANLDGVQTFTGMATKQGIEFERGGKRENIKAGSGAETGMKWLSSKKDCLVVTYGEGYCRD